MADFCRGIGKESWPELLGVCGEFAVKVIVRENHKVGVFIVKEGMMVTMDYRCDRVRVWVDANGLVKQVPKVG
ncbi:hypothetical protein ACHQM5_014419 [Ranunculus cassubicifolius]